MRKFASLLLIPVVLLALGACGDTGGPVSADYPAKPISMIVPVPAGDSFDLTARAMADALTAELSQTVVVTNMPGASQEIGWAECYNAAPDGYTLAITAAPTMILPPLSDSTSYDFEAYQYLMAACTVPYMVVVYGDSNIYTPEDLLAYSREHRVIFAGGLAKGSLHYAGVDFVDQIGLQNVSFVAFDGKMETLMTVASGDCIVGITDYATAEFMLENGRVRALCVLWNQRLPECPDIPTSVELGYPTLIHSAIRGYIAPPGTPREICDILTEAMYRAVERDDYKEAEKNLGLTRNILSGEEFKVEMEAAYENYARLVELEQSWSS